MSKRKKHLKRKNKGLNNTLVNKNINNKSSEHFTYSKHVSHDTYELKSASYTLILR